MYDAFFLSPVFLSSSQDPTYKDNGGSHRATQLNSYLPKPKAKDGHYLVDSKKSAADAVEEAERKELEEKVPERPWFDTWVLDAANCGSLTKPSERFVGVVWVS